MAGWGELGLASRTGDFRDALEERIMGSGLVLCIPSQH